MDRVKGLSLFIFIVSIITLGILIYLFINVQLPVDPDYAIIAIIMNAALMFISLLLLITQQCKNPSKASPLK